MRLTQSLFVLLAALGGVSAGAADSIALACKARQALVGGSKTGTVLIHASTEGASVLGSPWKFNVSWQGENSALVKEGASCGQTLPVDYRCEERQSLPGLPFTLHQDCGEATSRGTLIYRQFVSWLVLWENYGYFKCESPTVNMHIELKDCVPAKPIVSSGVL